MEYLGYKAIVSGKVQGVGFRYFTAKKAIELAVFGYAKNLANGDVEVVMYGNDTQLNKLLEWLSIGPQMATVNSIDTTEIPFIKENKFSCY
jgi:acylphosphatase